MVNRLNPQAPDHQDTPRKKIGAGGPGFSSA